MVLSANNKVDVLGRSIRNSTLNRIESPTSSIKSNSSDETSSDKVRLNDELLHMIITNNMNNIITKTTTSSILNNNNNNNAQKSMITTKINPIIDDHHMKTKQFNDDDDLKNYNTTYHKIKQTKKTPTGFNTDSMMINSDVSNYMMKKNSQRMNTNAGVNDLMADSDPKKAMAASGNFNINKEMSTMLDSNRVRMMSIYFNYSSVVSHAIKDWFDGTVRGKIGSEQILYDNVLLFFAYLYCARNIMLAFIEDIELRGWLGEGERIRPYRQLVMVLTIWSVYMVAILRNFRPNPLRKQPLSWLEPFRVLRGESTPKSFGLSEPMLHSWFEYSISMWRFYFGFALVIFMVISLQTLGMLRHRWNNYHDPQSNNWYNIMLLFWTMVQIGWAILICTHTYICVVFFNSLCYYFRIRYEKVNEDIEIIINKRLKANERVALLHHILVEHNSLCLKVSEYNKFWSSHLMSTYFFLVAVICFSSFQAFFTANLVIVRLYMFGVALLAGYIITRISVSAAIMSNRAHEPYGRLIRVTFEKYPVELQIQLRMFIQRTSGPTIGFYCLDVFEITYTTYASILAALGQNFLLIVDFVRSYAEVGKEFEEISFSDLNMLTGSVFNSTLDVLDEMTGTHISEALHSNGSFVPF
ncbi:hypothetical protein DERF_009681 [Dermatophagoides farinae]|uniref:Gustatory receptor n=1 Tax=Dermatophagoides farinae TaxID=6954 RepID=A0A922L489_DERFA|nr:hypothetical protein DERF_009681 [Dermatophagoides farinae]